LPIGPYAFGFALLVVEADIDRYTGQWKTNWTSSCGEIT